MLSRRHLRIKVLQSLYAFIQSGNDRLDMGERELLKSIDKLYEQYIYLLSFLKEVFEFAETRMEENKKKHLPTKEDLDPNTKFIDNRFIKQLTDNRVFRRKEYDLKINWVDEQEMLRKFYVKLRDSRLYKDYMSSSGDSYQEDKDLCIQIVKKHLTDFPALEFYFEEKNIYWASDYYLAVWLVLKSIKGFENDHDSFHPLPGIFKTADQADNEDLAFIKKLFRKTILRKPEADELIEQRAKNWEIERIATMDKLILEMAIIELMEFDSIPIKVSLNEYIELAKIFSTAKSRVFINGILDKLIEDLKKENKIIKKGRGLMT
ncbi:MAG: transcription antitermination factor NusB [Bacteroidales bacterium]|nr:transcription antitermination factor NusB [Bacteroidales bacterium]MCF8398536.1 transcription antitermination factor NusB [Bacteroidales bacterium]